MYRALNAEGPASGTAQFVPHSRNYLMMAAACPAVETKHGTMINQYPGSAVIAWPHKVN